MSVIEAGFYSHLLGKYTSVNVILPLNRWDFTKPETAIREKFPVIYLLHGLGGNHTIWTRFSSIERYAEKKGIAVVMPQGDNSYYVNNPHGGKYYDFITGELLTQMERLFPISGDPEKRYIGGLSMGGYGALLAGLGHPELYAGAATLSGRTGIMERGEAMDLGKENYRFFNAGLGENMEYYDASIHEPCGMLRKLMADGAKVPRLFVACGTEDHMYTDTTHFRDVAQSLGADMVYWEAPGIHDWNFWDQAIQHVMDWLPGFK